MSWRPEMDTYILGQRVMTNLGVSLGCGMALYATNALDADLDLCSFGPAGFRSVYYSTFSADVSECRNRATDEFREYATGGSNRASASLIGFLLIQIVMSVLLIAVDVLHHRLKMLSQVTFLSLVQTLWYWLTLPCYAWMVALAVGGFSASCTSAQSRWKGSLSSVETLPAPATCQDVWFYRWHGNGQRTYEAYMPFNMSFLVALGMCLALLFHVLSTVLLLPQTYRWAKNLRETYTAALHPVYRIIRPGDEEDF